MTGGGAPLEPGPAERGPVPDDAFVRVGEERVYDGWLISVAHARFTDPAGEPFERDIVHHPGAVAVIPVDDAGVVTLIRQYRPAVGRFVLEIPAGTCDVDGEDPAATAGRELAEEVGLAAEALLALSTVYNSPGYTDQRTTIYLATGLTPCAPDRRGVEERWLEVVRRPLADLCAPGGTASGPDGAEPVADGVTTLAVHLAAAALGGAA